MSTDKEAIKLKIKEILSECEGIVFAYLHGSFNETYFRDVDIAVYVDEEKITDFLRFELDVSTEIERVVRLPIDLKVLNDTPMSFKYRVIKGELLISNDEERRFKFIERLLIEYLDFKPIEEQIIKDILSS
ncbi:MAG: nucleotidyltransferase domain-containing protein [Candidatus Thorarchaeota archaeon]